MWTVIFFALALAFYFVVDSFPVMTGFSAKQMCTCIFVSGRYQKDTMLLNARFGWRLLHNHHPSAN